jgi:hypothetical protein
MRLRTRLRRVERGFPDPGCLACRRRRADTVMVGSRRLPDGTATRDGEWPAPCERCGEIPEGIIEVVEAEVTREDTDRLAAGSGPGGA